jgi:hypothetical protein
MTRLILGLTLAGLVAGLSAPGIAAEQPAYPPLAPNPPDWPSPQTEAKLRGAIDQMVDAFAELLREVPRYAPPEINQNGDIILRRLTPPAGPPSGPPSRRPTAPGQDEDKT